MTHSTTYTVRPLGCTSWEDGLQTIDDARRSREEAKSAGLRQVIIVEDDSGAIVE